jgi:hypothetical protein
MKVPDGFELNFHSTEPVWFGPEFERSWVNWDFSGYAIWASDGSETRRYTLPEAKELHRQLTGILAAMNELEAEPGNEQTP